MMELQKSSRFKGRKGPVVLIIMDGFGIGKENEGNALYLSRTPNIDYLTSNYMNTSLKAHGTAVGLPSDEDMGNSEVGHNALGAGRIFDQGAKLVQNAIEDKSLFDGKTWLELTAYLKESGGRLHFVGLLSDGNVHSHQ